MNRSLHFFFLISTVFLFFSTGLIANTLSVKVNSQKLVIGEPLILNLVYSGDDANSFGEPDLSSMKKGFDLVGRQQSFSSKQINGDYKVELKIAFKFLPKHSGTFYLPSFYIGNDEFSPPYKILVADKIVKKIEKKKETNLFFIAGAFMFILGGLLFLLSGVYIAVKSIRKKKR